MNKKKWKKYLFCILKAKIIFKIVSLQQNSIIFGATFKWLMNDSILMKTQIHVMLYKIDIESGNEKLFRETSFNIVDVYRYQPISIWVPMFHSDKV